MKFVKDTLLTFSTQIITVILGVITSVILARALGPMNLGVYSLIILTFTILGTFGNLGIAISNTYYGVKKEYEWNEIASNSLIVAFILGIILIIVFIVFYYLQPSFLKNIDLSAILISTISLPFILLIPYFQNILLGQDRINAYNSINIIQSILYLLLIVIVLYFNRNLSGVVISLAISYIITAIMPILLVYRFTPFKLQFNIVLFKKSVNFGLKGYLGNLIQFFNYRIDMYLISFLLLNNASVGYYSISVMLAESLWYLPNAIGTLVFARTPGLTDAEKNRTTPQICRNTLFITTVLAIILFITGKYIILILYGSKYLPALEPLWVLLPGIISLSICKVLSNEIIGRGKPMINTYAAIISLVINIPLNIIFIPQMGIIGSALASSISYIIITLIVLTSFIKLSKNSLKETLILKKEDVEIYKKLLSKVYKINNKL
ncbi:flippase [Methanobacterium sp. BAmetb5]|uniref:flippase n=1 Tax=Methanobacterium sp. BAmetb5 TaxID=2025351 RepID=UPI000E8F56CD|nr:flippase [Methanobacterium sp. BAmetb5]AXV40952.1 MAG: hypothetical protein CIT02_11815 [Methanobacterium sp. BAmetb5]